MNADQATMQRIGRLMPLADLLAEIDQIPPVATREIAVSTAAGCALAADVIATSIRPATRVALRDGWAVTSEVTRDAGPYAPMPLVPAPERVDAFAPMPAGTDAVAPLDAVESIGGQMHILGPVGPGEDVLPAGTETASGTVLCKAGARLRATDVAALLLAGEARVVARIPRIRIVSARPNDRVLDVIVQFLSRLAQSLGAEASNNGRRDFDRELRDDTADVVIGVGGTGSGRQDHAVTALAHAGTVISHGIGLLPGDTAAFGHVNARPVLLIPGRIDAALACWLLLGRRLVEKLSGAALTDTATSTKLSRKVVSTIGMAEVILVRRNDQGAEPLASGFLSLQSLAQADGWIFVPAESEGYPAGTEVRMRPLP